MTHVCQYTGPGSIPVLLRDFGTVYCHDASFRNGDTAKRFEMDNPGTVALISQTPGDLIAEVAKRGLTIDTVIHNDVHPNVPLPIEEIPQTMFQTSLAALLLFPVELTQGLLPEMKASKRGRFVFVTSARYRQPEVGFSVATTVRSATTAFAQSLAREAAPFGIQVNIVAPNYLYSEAYYPRARFIDDPTGRAEIAKKVPMGRLGTPEEIGELIGFLASGKSSFITGQVIDFTGGWP